MNEEQKAIFCDEYCYYAKMLHDQEKLDKKCEKCVLNEVHNDSNCK